MKKIISIQLLLLILFTGINVNIASHFCGGHFRATKVSLNGDLASCGMEESREVSSPQDLLKNHCCEDVLSSFCINPHYIPSDLSYVHDYGMELIHIFILSDRVNTSRELSINADSGDKRPPGFFYPASVEQPIICIFRI
jgi:hypothetical protein